MPVIFEDTGFNIDPRLVSTVAKSTSVILALDKENTELKELVEDLEETIDLMSDSNLCS